MFKFFNKSLLIILISFSMVLIYPDIKIKLIHTGNNDILAKENDNNISLNKRACWVSFLDIEKFLCDLDEDAYRYKIDEMYDNMLANNLNTVIFHVRPMGDAIYPSKIFPWSIYISSDRSLPLYDPLQIAIDEAHSKGLRFEAWINPYRVSRNNETTISYEQTEFYELYKDIIIEYENVDGETCLSLDPGRKESTTLVCAGVSEIVENYEVDGIHFDDYFYIDGMLDELSQEEKMANVNNMVSEVYKTIKTIDKTCTFGISPAGNMDNARNDGADIDTWLSNEGYVDYIMPQLYWSDDFITLDGERVDMFRVRCEDWKSVNKLDIPIYAGLALYKSGETFENDLGWCSCDDNLKKQCNIAFETGYSGYSLFRYEWIERLNAQNELKNLDSYIEEAGVLKQEEKQRTYLTYKTYIYGIGGKGASLINQAAGIGGISNGIGGLSVDINSNKDLGGVCYRVHYLGNRWSVWARNGEMTRLSSDLRPIDGIQIRLYKSYANIYDIYYKVGYKDGTWTKWSSNGEISGYIGVNGIIDKLEIKLEKK